MSSIQQQLTEEYYRLENPEDREQMIHKLETAIAILNCDLEEEELEIKII